MSKNLKILPLLGSIDHTYSTECEICQQPIEGMRLPVVSDGQIDGYVCEDCFERVEEPNKNRPSFLYFSNDPTVIN